MRNYSCIVHFNGMNYYKTGSAMNKKEFIQKIESVMGKKFTQTLQFGVMKYPFQIREVRVVK